MTPYYQDDYATIYHGDCRLAIPSIGIGCRIAESWLLYTDPPYGIDLDTDYSRFDSSDAQGRKHERIYGDAIPMNFGFLFDLCDVRVIFGANNWPQQIPFNCKTDGWIAWDKRTNEVADKLFGSPFELAVVSGRRMYEIIRMQHCGVKNADGDHSGRFHPTQKPVALAVKIISMFKHSHIFDPFMGSGTTLRAAKDLQRKSIGIEIEERYCEIAAKRLAQEVLAL